MWTAEEFDIWANPSLVLSRARGRGDVVQGLVPTQGITWLYGPSMSFKSFVAMGIAAAVSVGREWCGKATTSSAVVFLGAEGGDALHLRRAAAEMGAGAFGPLLVISERPVLDTSTGASWLRGLLNGITQTDDGSAAMFASDQAKAFQAVADAEASEEWVATNSEKEDAQQLGGRSGAFLEAHIDYLSSYLAGARSILCVIDTYSQTSGGDEKQNVAAYINNLRAMIGDAKRDKFDLSFLVVDHATKGGGSYLGSVAKLNDVDSQIEVTRDGNGMKTRVQHRKTKDGRHSDDLVVDLVPYVFGGRDDAYGEPLQTLVVKQARDTELSGRAAVVADLLADGSMTVDNLRAAYYALPENKGVRLDTRGKAFRRVLQRLVEQKHVFVDGQEVHLNV